MGVGKWRKKRNVARVVQKWLAVPETSTISELVLYICRLVDTAKQLNLLSVLTKNQVFLQNNIKIHLFQEYTVGFHR